MRAFESRLPTTRPCVPDHPRAPGFSMVELLVTIVLAGIVFAAMVPFFANALNRTSEDELRVDSTNIAQDRIEQIRLLAYTDVTSGNLNSPTASPFGDDRFGHAYTLVGETKPYHIDYVVSPTPSPGSAQKYVQVSVSRAGSSYVTTADTIIQDPTAGGMTLIDAEPTGLSMTVQFNNWTQVDYPGVYFRRVQTNVTPYATTTPGVSLASPGVKNQMPVASHQRVTWTDLIGGPNYTYTIFVPSTEATYVLACPPFRLWSNGIMPFDTYPGGD